MSVTDTSIRQWADRHDCRDQLPVLVRRLIRETTPELRSMRFPGNDAVDLHGLDGDTEAEVASTWVPEGRTVWEMGCNQNPSAKANGDYTKRTDETPQEVMQSSSFAFVTPRRWNDKQEWIDARLTEGKWKDVRVFDSVDLETWLENAPATARWLGERLGIMHPGLLTPEEWWLSWSSASTPPIIPELVSTRRQNEPSELLRKLRANEAVVTVLADDSQEAVAFTIASAMEANADDILDRMLIVTRSDTSINSNGEARSIIVVDLPENSDVNLRDRRKLTLIRPYPKGRLDVQGPLQLSHVTKDAFRSALVKMGLREDDAARLGMDTGHSVAVLRRHLSRDPEVRLPRWARTRAAAKRLLPFALAGSWVESGNQEDQAVLELLGEVSGEELEASRDDLLSLEEAPLARYGNVNVVVSKIDAIFAIGPFLTCADVDRFFQLYEGLLSERDPALDLPPEQWWMANVLGHDRSYSGALLSGLGDTLCILATHGEAICGKRLNIDLSFKANQMVRRLLEDATADHWLSLRNQLRILAEAAPSAFLDGLETELRRPEPPIESIMGTVSGGVSGDCLRTDLLWSLELLAWLPNCFFRVAAVTFDLMRFELDDNWVNTPTNTAAALFRTWLPASTLSASQRIAVLRLLSARFRLPTISVCISQLPADSRSWASRTSRPRWRPIECETPDPTHESARYCAEESSRLLLDLAPYSSEEFCQVLEAFERLHPNDAASFLVEAERFASTLDDEAKAAFRHKLRTKTLYHGRNGRGDGTEFETAYSSLKAFFNPVSARWRHRWLFDEHYVDWRALIQEEDEESLSYSEREERVRDRRVDALNEIASKEGEAELLNFALLVNHPNIIAEILVAKDSTPQHAANWIEAVLDAGDSGASQAVLSQFLWTMGLGDLSETIGLLEGRNCLEDRDSREFFVRCLPGRAVGWGAARQMGAKWETLYWSSARIHLLNDDPDEDYETAAENLLNAGRARSAFWAMRLDREKISASLWERILEKLPACGETDIRIPDGYQIDRVLTQLDTSPEVSEARIVQLELPFAPLLSHYGHRSSKRTLALHRCLAKDPSLFIQLLSWMYKREDDVAEPELDGLSDTHRKNLWDIAHHTLSGWNEVPGLAEEGEIDAGTFVEWNKAAHRLAGEASRSEVAEIHLGAVYARLARQRSWEDWLPEPTLRLLDEPERSSLRRHFQIGVQNARGVTTRNPYDGGDQERFLAGRYRELASRFGNSFPRVAEMLGEIAESYEQDAERHDEQAALGERWHP